MEGSRRHLCHNGAGELVLCQPRPSPPPFTSWPPTHHSILMSGAVAIALPRRIILTPPPPPPARSMSKRLQARRVVAIAL